MFIYMLCHVGTTTINIKNTPLKMCLLKLLIQLNHSFHSFISADIFI